MAVSGARVQPHRIRALCYPVFSCICFPLSPVPHKPFRITTVKSCRVASLPTHDEHALSVLPQRALPWHSLGLSERQKSGCFATRRTPLCLHWRAGFFRCLRTTARSRSVRAGSSWCSEPVCRLSLTSYRERLPIPLPRWTAMRCLVRRPNSRV